MFPHRNISWLFYHSKAKAPESAERRTNLKMHFSNKRFTARPKVILRLNSLLQLLRNVSFL